MTFLDVMDLWDSPQALADDLGYKLSRVQKWRVRRSIPPDSWSDLIEAAKRRGFNVTAETLLDANSAHASRADSMVAA